MVHNLSNDSYSFSEVNDNKSKINSGITHQSNKSNENNDFKKKENTSMLMNINVNNFLTTQPKVSFSSVEVRCYDMILDNNPGKDGSDLTLSLDYSKAYSMSLDKFESLRKPKRKVSFSNVEVRCYDMILGDNPG